MLCRNVLELIVKKNLTCFWNNLSTDVDKKPKKKQMKNSELNQNNFFKKESYKNKYSLKKKIKINNKINHSNKR